MANEFYDGYKFENGSSKREIKFRGYSDDYNRWFFGDMTLAIDGSHFILSANGSVRERIMIDPESLGQFTGMYDSHDEEIFEGDIVRYTRQYLTFYNMKTETLTNLCVVKYDDESHRWAQDTYDEKRCFSSGGLGFHDDRAKVNFSEVIGNIYQNADLLPGSKDTKTAK